MQSSLCCLTWLIPSLALDEDACAIYTFTSSVVVAVAGLAGDLWVHLTRNYRDANLWQSFWLLQPCSIIHKPELGEDHLCSVVIIKKAIMFYKKELV